MRSKYPCGGGAVMQTAFFFTFSIKKNAAKQYRGQKI